MNTVVVGAGLGGLAAAIEAAAAGFQVAVVESAPSSGGKVGTAVLDGVEVDTGPSVLTLPDVLRATLSRAGMRLEDHLSLRAPAPAFRYLYPDGVVVDVYAEPEQTLVSVDRALGSAARAELADFLAYAGRIWDVSQTAFIRGDRPGWRTLFDRPPSEWVRVFDIDPFRTMDGAIAARVRNPYLRTLLRRYATYNGSDVRRAPAALNCISHVELALGGFGVEGGVSRIAAVMEQAARRLGVGFHFCERVDAITGTPGQVTGVTLQSGRTLPADAVVWNGEVAALHTAGAAVGLSAPTPSLTPDSTSGWTGILRTRRRTGAAARVAHTVVFPADYTAEFQDLFDRRRTPVDPTVYLCAQEPCHGRTGWTEDEPVFAMINAPAEDLTTPSPFDADAVGAQVLRRLITADLVDPGARWVWCRTPRQLAERFPASGGSLYGRASNSMWAGFRRPANRVDGVRGLYVAGGTAHPGGGMPLVMLSGQAAVRSLVADFGSRPSLLTAQAAG